VPIYKWRLIDARAFIYQGRIKMIKVDDLRWQDYIAISYTWSDGMKKWRERILSLGGDHDYEDKIAKGSFGISAISDFESTDDQSIIDAHLFFTSVAFMVFTRCKALFWMDILCINQDVEKEQAYFVPKMGSVYCNAAETHSYLSGSSLLASLSCDEFYFPIWEKRAWTVQEHIQSKKPLSCYCFNGDLSGVLGPEDKKALPSSPIELLSPVVESYSWFSGGIGYGLVWKKKKTVTCYMETSGMGGVLPNKYINDHMFGPQFNQSVSRTTMYKALWQLRESYTRNKAISTALVLLGERKATREQDMIYSLLGLLEMENYHVSYKVTFEEARLSVFEAMKPDILGATLGTDWGCHSNTKNKDSALPRVVDSHPTIGISLLKTTNSAEYSRGVGTKISARTEKCRIWNDPSRRQSGNLGVLQALMGGHTRLAIFYCVGLFEDPDFKDIPTSEIPEKKIHPIVLGDRSSDGDLFDENFKYDRVSELVEIGTCIHHVLLAETEDAWMMYRTGLLALECDRTASGDLTNRGTVLLLNAGGLSDAFSTNVVV